MRRSKSAARRWPISIATRRTSDRPISPGELGQRIFLYGPRQQKWDFSLVKKTNIGEHANVEFRMQALNAFNLTNFLLFAPGQQHHPAIRRTASAFGQTSGAYRDLSNTNDPGGRILEFALRFNFY